MEAPRWQVITPSQFEWERRGLDFVRAGLPDHDPYLAWTNFEFVAGHGALYEVDLLVLSKRGFWLVECKAWEDQITGDAGTWTRSSEGKTRSEDNPVLLANRKAKALGSLLREQAATRKVKLPRLEALVFLSADGVQCDLQGPARYRVCLKDIPADSKQPGRDGILQALINRKVAGVPELDQPIDVRIARALKKAVGEAGIRPSQRSRRVGDYVLHTLLTDNPTHQDWLARHTSLAGVECKVRQYTVAHASSEDDRQRLRRAAAREFELLRDLEHRGILPALDYKEHELGPSLLFRWPGPDTQRLDHFIAAHGHRLEVGQRLDMLRQLADAIRHAHTKRVIHRALGPQSVLVTKASTDSPDLKIFDWQVGARDSTSTSGRVTQVEPLVEAQALAYLPPEATATTGSPSPASDVFSLGALAYLLFAGRPPASGPDELRRLLRENRGLSLASVVDGVADSLEQLIRSSTHPDVQSRLGSAKEFLEGLDAVENELTEPDEEPAVDPLRAKPRETLEQGFEVVRVLGQGATARVLLVQRDGTEYVLKVPLTPDDEPRLHDEAESLSKLYSEFIVPLVEKLEVSGRICLLMRKVGERTLADLLRKEGPPGLELLGRYGDDLLAAVEHLEAQGIAHRDIKPDNIAVRERTKQRNQLVLFDFSLTKAAIDNLRVGTLGYTDPFLENRKPARWDTSAERFSAAVTLYEMTVGAGSLPTWGDGQSDPSMTDGELVLEAERFDPSVRDGLIDFFERALARDPAERFHNAEEMRQAWRVVFDEAEQRKVRRPTGEELDLAVALDKVTLSTPIASLGLSTRARNRLERAEVLTVRELLQFPIGEIHVMSGVGNQTRQEIVRYIAELRTRFPDVENRRVDPAVVSLEGLYDGLLGQRSSRSDSAFSVRADLLGAADGPSRVPHPPEEWPSQTEVAERLNLSRARIGQLVKAERERWLRSPALTALREELRQKLLEYGGVLPIGDVLDIVLTLRSAAETEEPREQRRLASGVARAAVEAEAAVSEPHYRLRRVAGTPIVACSLELAEYARELGRVADVLAGSDPLASPKRVFEELFAVSPPALPEGCQPLDSERLLRLAAAVSASAAISPKQELYPRRMSAERALRLAIGIMPSSATLEDGFTPAELSDRIASRYPEADPVPGRPQLDEVLQRAGFDVRWDPDRLRYVQRKPAVLATSGTTIPPRRPTASTGLQPEITPEMAEARSYHERLQHAYREGGFLVLMLDRPKFTEPCVEEITRHFDFDVISFDDLFLEALRAEAAELEVDWSYVLEADGAAPDSVAWSDLLLLTQRVEPKLTRQLLDHERPTLLVHPGAIARYDLMGILETARDRIGHDARCPCLWLLLVTDSQGDLPMLDHAEIPLISPSQRTHVTEPWIRNLGRAMPEGPAARPSL